MACSEEQKQRGRQELARRRATQDGGTYRASFLKVAAAFIALLLFAILAVLSIRFQPTLLMRLGGMALAVLAIVGAIFSACVMYVRLLDWRRAEATDRQRPVRSVPR